MNLSISYILMVVGILLAKAMGFVRELFLGNNFGTGLTMDIYAQVFSVASVIFTAFGVALSTFVIKSINNKMIQNETEEREFVGFFFKYAMIFSLLFTVVLYALSYPITKLLLPGLSEADFSVALKLFWIMLPSLTFIVLTYTAMGLLQNKNKFFITSVVSFPFNAILILSMILEVRDIYTLGAVTTIGWAAHFLFLLPSLLKQNYKLWSNTNQKDKLSLGNPAEILFILISNMVFQLLFIIDKAFASVSEGFPSAIHYGSTLFTTVSSIFLVAMSAVFFPSVTKAMKVNDTNTINRLIRYALTFMFAIFVPFLMIVGIYHRDIITLLYLRGEFTMESVNLVAPAFLLYAFCVFGYITQELLFKIFYAKGKYKLTVISAISILLLNLIANCIFRNSFFGIVGSTTVICIIFAIVMFWWLAKECNGFINKDFFKNVGIIVLSSLVFVVVHLIFKHTCGYHNKLMFILPVVTGALIYLAVLYRTNILKLILTAKEEK
ncbi:MAG: hypothetical protein J6K51_06325 [Clostridia bacterium]|nr:hypothetical protein [Clostridia bacterium]